METALALSKRPSWAGESFTSMLCRLSSIWASLRAPVAILCAYVAPSILIKPALFRKGAERGEFRAAVLALTLSASKRQE